MGRIERLAPLVAAVTLTAAAAACRARETPEQAPPAKGEMPVEQTPVSSIYDQKPGVLYERPAKTVSPAPSPATTSIPAPTAGRTLQRLRVTRSASTSEAP